MGTSFEPEQRQSAGYPEACVKWGQVPKPGQNCCPSIVITLRDQYSGETPLLSFSPPEKLRDGFSGSRFQSAEFVSSGSSEFVIPLQPAGNRLPGGWIGKLPFQVPHDADQVKGEHLFQFWLNFPCLWRPVPRFFEMTLKIWIEADPEETLTIRGDGPVAVDGAHRFKHIVVEGEGVKYIRQGLSSLLDKDSTSQNSASEVHALEVRENRRIRLPVVYSSGDRDKFVQQADGMLVFDDDEKDHRLYFFRSRELRLGRHDERCEVPIRFVPNFIPETPNPQPPDLADRQLNLEASENICRTHLIISVQDSGVSITNFRKENGQAAKTRLDNEMLKADERRSPGVNRNFELRLGGSRSNPEMPLFEISGRVIAAWNDGNSMGIPPVESALSVTREDPAKAKSSSEVDSVILHWGKERRQAFVTCVMIRRQVFLDTRGRVVDNPGAAAAALGVRIFHSGRYFFAQSVANPGKLQFAVDGRCVPQYDVVLLQPESRLEFLRGTQRLASGHWLPPKFRTR